MTTGKHNTNWLLDPSKSLVIFLSGTKGILVKFDSKIK